MRQGIAGAILLPLCLLTTAPAQYITGPAAGTYSSIAGVPSAVRLATVSGCDDCTEVVNLSFPFSWYGGAPQTSVAVSSNGAIIMDGSTGHLCCQAWALDDGQAGGTPAFFAPTPRISVVQEDLDPQGTGGDVWALDLGTSIIISFESCVFFPGPANGSANGQAELFANGDIEIRLGTISSAGNDIACGLTDPQGGTTVWFSPNTVIPEFNAVGQTGGGVMPAAPTGVRYTFGSGAFQVNSAAASFDVNGAVSDAFSSARSTVCAGAPSTANFNSNLAVGTPFDLGIVAGAAIPDLTGTLGGQFVNLDINSTLPNGPVWLGTALQSFPPPAPGLPWAGAPLTLPFAAPPVPVLAHAQGYFFNPANPDLISLTAPAELETLAAGSTQTLTLGDDDFVEVLFGLPFCAPFSSFSFYGTAYTSVFVNSNGSLGFGSGDASFVAGVPAFKTNSPRAAGMWTDLSPNVLGMVTVTASPIGVTTSFAGVSEFGAAANLSSFDMVLGIAGQTSFINYAPAPGHGTDTLIGITPGGNATDPTMGLGISFDGLAGLGSQVGAATDMLYEFTIGGPVPNTVWTQIVWPSSDGQIMIVI